MFNKIVKIATELDELGYVKEAEMLDNALRFLINKRAESINAYPKSFPLKDGGSIDLTNILYDQITSDKKSLAGTDLTFVGFSARNGSTESSKLEDCYAVYLVSPGMSLKISDGQYKTMSTEHYLYVKAEDIYNGKKMASIRQSDVSPTKPEKIIKSIIIDKDDLGVQEAEVQIRPNTPGAYEKKNTCIRDVMKDYNITVSAEKIDSLPESAESSYSLRIKEFNREDFGKLLYYNPAKTPSNSKVQDSGAKEQSNPESQELADKFFNTSRDLLEGGALMFTGLNEGFAVISDPQQNLFYELSYGAKEGEGRIALRKLFELVGKKQVTEDLLKALQGCNFFVENNEIITVSGTTPADNGDGGAQTEPESEDGNGGAQTEPKSEDGDGGAQTEPKSEDGKKGNWAVALIVTNTENKTVIVPNANSAVRNVKVSNRIVLCVFDEKPEPNLTLEDLYNFAKEKYDLTGVAAAHDLNKKYAQPSHFTKFFNSKNTNDGYGFRAMSEYYRSEANTNWIEGGFSTDSLGGFIGNLGGTDVYCVSFTDIQTHISDYWDVAKIKNNISVFLPANDSEIKTDIVFEGN